MTAGSGERGDWVSIPWRLLDGLGPQSSTFRIAFDEVRYLIGQRVVARETAHEVEVTVQALWSPPPGGWFADTREATAMVKLPTPVGDRELVHAPTNWPILWKPGMRLPG